MQPLSPTGRAFNNFLMFPKSQSPVVVSHGPLLRHHGKILKVSSAVCATMPEHRQRHRSVGTEDAGTGLLEGKCHRAWHWGHEEFESCGADTARGFFSRIGSHGPREERQNTLVSHSSRAQHRPSSGLAGKNSGTPPPAHPQSQSPLRFVTICVLSHFHMPNVFWHFSLDF